MPGRIYNGGNYRYGFNGKENDNEVKGNGNSLDFGARMYDSRLGRWLSVDPLQIKYPDLTPYHYCDNSPIRIKDEDGRDIIVLSAPNGAGGFGHAAVLIGNDKDGWKLYSKNGTNGYVSGSASSGPSDKNPEIAVPFKSLKDFANSKSNFTEEGDIEYKSAFRITTDKATDEKMARAAASAVSSDYDVLSNSCIDVCSEALKAGGLDEGFKKINTYVENMEGELVPVTIGSKSNIPNERYKQITKNNPGKDVSKSIVPDKNVANKKKQTYLAAQKAKKEAAAEEEIESLNQEVQNGPK